MSLSKSAGILFITRPSAGGIRKHLLSLIEYLRQNHYEIFLICPQDDSELVALRKQGIKVYPMKIRGDLNPYRDIQVALHFRKLIQKIKPAIVHAHSYKAGLLCLFAGWLRKRPPIICTFHNPVRRHQGKFKEIFSRWLISTAGKQMDHIIVVSQALRHEAETILGVPTEKISCIHNGIDLAEFPTSNELGNYARRKLGVERFNYIVGTVSRLIPEKGIQHLIEAASILKDKISGLCFIVVGDGPYRFFLKELIIEKGVEDNFFLTGFRSDVAEILYSFDLFVLPSTEEALSIAILEAMGAQIPVIASSVGGIPEIVTEETGVLIPPANPEELAKNIHNLLLRPLHRKKLGCAGRERVERFFSLENMTAQYHNLYLTLIRPASVRTDG